MKHMDKSNFFDQKIRDAINKYEVPFDDTAWKNIEKEINTPIKQSPVFKLKPWFMAAAVAASLLIAYVAFVPEEVNTKTELSKNENITKKAEEKPASEKTEVQGAIPEKNKEENKVEIKEAIAPLTKKTEPEVKVQDKELEVLEPIEDQLLVEEEKPETETNDPVNNDGNSEDLLEEELLVDISINSQELCENEYVILALRESNAPVEIVWDFGDGFTADGSGANHIYEESGTYLVKAHAKSLLNDHLIHHDSFPVTVKPAPKADFEIEKNDNMYALPEVSFKTEGDRYASLEWDFEDGNVQNESLVKKLFKNKGLHKIGLIVRNEFQCSDTLYKDLSIEEDFNLLAPNAFSPNGDGINDTFIPQALAYLNQHFTLQIFDPKSSQLIFESNNFEIPWNGTMMNNGNKMNEGAYAWSVRTEDGSVYKGTILITAK
jgi:gliding motility-associated-like protein